jgi:hypothetical protein
MNLYDILNTNKTINREFNDNRYQRVNNNYDQGVFSSVYGKKNDPHSVIKTNKILSDDNDRFDVKTNDGYYHYIKLLDETKIYEQNPYFLRVRNIHVIKDKEGKAIYNFDVEKLFPLYKFSKEIIHRYFNKIFNLNDDYDEYFNSIDDIYELVYYALMRDRHLIKDNLLKEALNFLRLNAGNYPPDFHTENIMYRGGKNGMQMVFSDPYGAKRGTQHLA